MNSQTAMIRTSGIGPASAIPVKIISLREQSARRSDLRKNGIPAGWVDGYFEATDLRSATTARLEAEALIPEMEAKIARPLLPAEIGCAMSHRAVACWLASSNHAMALVLEDDIIPQVDDWLEQVEATATSLLAHANRGAAFICHLGARHNQADSVLNRRVTWRRGRPQALPNLFVFAGYDRSLWRAHAYLISRAAAVRGCRTERKVQTLADDWVERRNRGLIDEIFFTRPILIGQDESRPSTICSDDQRDESFQHPPNRESMISRLRRTTISRTSYRLAVLRSHIPYRLP